MKVLLISPAFHSYWRSVARALEIRGHECAVHVYDEHAGLAQKLHTHLTEELPRRMGQAPSSSRRERATLAAIAALDAHQPDAVLIIKGDTLGDRFWDAIVVSRINSLIWLYDEIRRTEYTPARLAQLAPIASYSGLDTTLLASLGASVKHVPLAFDHTMLPAQPTRMSREVVFVGARYPQRERTLLTLRAQGVPVRAYGRQWSHRLVDRARTWELSRPPIPAGRDLQRDKTYQVMAAAAATLNIHRDQDGFTMRTFEACGVGAVQLLDRPDVIDLYDPGTEVVVYSTADELAELCHRIHADRRWTGILRRAAQRRTLAEHTFAHRVKALEELWG